jgi:hypothetical protein
MRFLHESNVSHGDLTSETVLVDGEGRAKLSGFGGGGLNQSEKAPAKTVKAMAASEQQADIASFGVILRHLIDGSVDELIADGSSSCSNKNNSLKIKAKHSFSGALESCMIQCFANTFQGQLHDQLREALEMERERRCKKAKTVPDGFVCPITQDVMKDPVTLLDGQSYERGAIERWFQLGKRRSPMTNEVLKKRTLIENYALKSTIAHWNASIEEH